MDEGVTSVFKIWLSLTFPTRSRNDTIWRTAFAGPQASRRFLLADINARLDLRPFEFSPWGHEGEKPHMATR
jgi:hypothetical protein